MMHGNSFGARSLKQWQYATENSSEIKGWMLQITEAQVRGDRTSWKVPPQGWIKINTNGAAKGNLGNDDWTSPQKASGYSTLLGVTGQGQDHKQ